MQASKTATTEECLAFVAAKLPRLNTRNLGNHRHRIGMPAREEGSSETWATSCSGSCSWFLDPPPPTPKFQSIPVHIQPSVAARLPRPRPHALFGMQRRCGLLTLNDHVLGRAR